jgi:photosystem II biogenesis protein Psp29
MNDTATGKTVQTHVKTVSDTKRDFYAHHTRPINSVYRRVVEELLVEMHLLSVNADFQSDPIYYLGVVTSFERLMQGYRPEKDKESIFNALCQSVGGNSELYKEQAGTILDLAKKKSPEDLVVWLSNPTATDDAEMIVEPIKAITANPNFKYSRLFAIGLYTLLEEADSEIVKQEDKRKEIIGLIANKLHLPEDKVNKDIDLYRSNLDKIDQILGVLEDVLQASRKQREKRIEEQANSD